MSQRSRIEDQNTLTCTNCYTERLATDTFGRPTTKCPKCGSPKSRKGPRFSRRGNKGDGGTDGKT